MANTIKVKRSAVQGKAPQTSDLQLGELAINTYDGKLFLKKNNGADAIVEVTAPAWSNITSKPTTISSFGITDAPTLTGANILSGANTLTIAAGSAAAPSLYPTGDSNTGIYSPGADQVSVATGGVERLRVDNVGQIKAVSPGNSTAPTFSFTSDPNTGIYNPDTDQLAITTGGNQRLIVDENGNVGLGVTPSTWIPEVVALQGPSSFSIANSGDGRISIIANASCNGDFYNREWVYIEGGAASYYEQASGTHRWYTAPSGTPGIAASFDEVMTLDESGRLGIGTYPSCRLAVGGTDAIKIAAGTTAQRPGSPSAGMIRYNTTLGRFEGYGSAWGSIGGGATGGGTDRVFVENDQTVTTNYTITSGRNASSAGPVQVASGVTVTVPSGSTWVIV